MATSGENEELVSADTGDPPRVINPSEGCRFRWRCPLAIEKCAQVTPRLTQMGSVQVACHVAAGDLQYVANADGTAPIARSRS